MIHKSIFEILEDKYDIKKEFSAVMKLFCQPSIVAYPQVEQGQLIPLEQAIDNCCFYSWKQRHGCINLADMKEKLGFDNRQSSNHDDMIVCLEYFCNLISSIQLTSSTLFYNYFYIHDLFSQRILQIFISKHS